MAKICHREDNFFDGEDAQKDHRLPRVRTLDNWLSYKGGLTTTPTTRASKTKGRFTPWTMKSDHVRGNFPWSDLNAPTSRVQFLKNYNAFGSLL